jgi:hypothetical protein
MDEDNETDAEAVDTGPDASVIQAKLDAVLEEHAGCADALAAKDAEITAVKAANYDLLMAVPVDEDNTTDNDSEPDDDTDIDIDDLFGE